MNTHKTLPQEKPWEANFSECKKVFVNVKLSNTRLKAQHVWLTIYGLLLTMYIYMYYYICMDWVGPNQEKGNAVFSFQLATTEIMNYV